MNHDNADLAGGVIAVEEKLARISLRQRRLGEAEHHSGIVAVEVRYGSGGDERADEGRLKGRPVLLNHHHRRRWLTIPLALAVWTDLLKCDYLLRARRSVPHR